MSQPHNTQYTEKPMTTYGRTQGPSRRYRRLRHPIFLSTEWTAKNPLLQRGEIGAESDTHRLKIGDGVTYWNDLPYTSDSVATWGAINGNIADQTDLKNALDGKVSTDGSSTMTGVLKMRASISFECAIAPYWHGVGLYQLNDNDSVTLLASMETPDGWCPGTNNTFNMGSTSKKWKNLYLSGSAYVSKINNGFDIAVPATNSADEFALKSQVDLKANIADLATVATTGSYTDLLNKPTLGTAAAANTTDFATAAQGTLADTALQPGDDVSDLNNDAGYQTAGDVATAISGKQDTLTAGTNITITGTTISATDTTYSNFTGASAGAAGTSGLVPAPAAGDQGKFLQGDGTWANPTAATAWGNITGTLSDQTDLQSALSGKADTATTLAGYGITDGANTSLSNLTVAGNNFCAHAGLPGTTYNNLTLGADGSVYLAPADGYFCLSVISFGVDGVIFMYRSSPRYGLSTRYTPYDWVDICLPISKGEYVTIQYTGTPTVQFFRFLYANSAS